MTIKLLDNHLINKIAAGEVIERPANVIKELLENAIDANATQIKIEIEDAGITKIKISDNGDGMERDDLHLACKRHATSKIKTEEDLNAIYSLGFRGEALASIAEVSNIKIKTKTKDNEVGYLLEIEGGIQLNDQKVGCSDGTIIEISNLFYNVPARKEFLKTPEVELAHIIEIVTKYAIINRTTTITLHHNKKEIINSPATDNQLNNIIYIYGTETAKQLIEVDYRTQNLKIQGYTSKPQLTRANKSEQSLYINGRYIRSKVISEAIYATYKTLLFTGRHPIFILNITINPKEIDINIHPNKLDVRLKKEQEVCEAFYLAIKKAFDNQILIPEVNLDNTEVKQQKKTYEIQDHTQSNLFTAQPTNEEVSLDQSQITSEYTIPKEDKKVYDHSIAEMAETKLQPYPEELEKLEKLNPFENINILGQTNKMFILAECEDGMLIIDQHAAEERVNYEKFVEERKNNALQKQALITPQVIELNPTQYLKTISQKEFLNNIGFDIEDFGNNTIKVSTIPQVFDRLKNANVLIDIINQLTTATPGIINKEIEDRIIRFACKASIKAGDEITLSQMNFLMLKLGNCENPYTCPHGRPTTIQLTKADLEKKFKRTGW
ncbi:MAG: DNA mismatch repair protein MutL [Patescibacteria group bacterium]|jgi:DNA mismatch repair protein MutL